jgi:hypothetical protein
MSTRRICKRITKQGLPCRNKALIGAEYCFSHNISERHGWAFYVGFIGSIASVIGLIVFFLPSPQVPSNGSSKNMTSDESKVLEELLKVEHDWTEANVKGDGAKLNYILADEYRGWDENGAVLNKTQAIGIKTANPVTIRPENIRIEDAKLIIHHGDTATISGILRAEYVEDSRIIHYQQRLTDSFVKRDGRWQAISSQTSEPIRQ